MNINLWGCLYWCDSRRQVQVENMGATTSSENCPQNSSGGNTAGCSNVVRERERRKKVTGFATLRKKLIRRRRSSKTCDHARVLREFVSNWNPSELLSLLEEYEALASLKDLAVQAELASFICINFQSNIY